MSQKIVFFFFFLYLKVYLGDKNLTLIRLSLFGLGHRVTDTHTHKSAVKEALDSEASKSES